MSDERIYDLVVYGATGFTGQLVVEYLANNYSDPKQLVWAMAGRSAEKLESIKTKIGVAKEVPVILADSRTG